MENRKKVDYEKVRIAHQLIQESGVQCLVITTNHEDEKSVGFKVSCHTIAAPVAVHALAMATLDAIIPAFKQAGFDEDDISMYFASLLARAVAKAFSDNEENEEKQ